MQFPIEMAESCDGWVLVSFWRFVGETGRWDETYDDHVVGQDALGRWENRLEEIHRARDGGNWSALVTLRWDRKEFA